MATCFKTVLVLSDQFIRELWPHVSNVMSLRTSTLLGARIHDDVVAVVCDPLCVIPPELFDVAKFYLEEISRCWERLSDLLTTSGMYTPLVTFGARCIRRKNRCAIAMMFIRLSVCPFVCLSGMSVHFNHTVHFSVDLSLRLDRWIVHLAT